MGPESVLQILNAQSGEISIAVPIKKSQNERSFDSFLWAQRLIFHRSERSGSEERSLAPWELCRIKVRRTPRVCRGARRTGNRRRAGPGAPGGARRAGEPRSRAAGRVRCPERVAARGGPT